LAILIRSWQAGRVGDDKRNAERMPSSSALALKDSEACSKSAESRPHKA
jgi:hypothetical protein